VLTGVTVLRLPVDIESAYWFQCLKVTSRYRECLLDSLFKGYQQIQRVLTEVNVLRLPVDTESAYWIH